MTQQSSKCIIVVGGGLAGLVSAIRLAKAGKEVVLIERKKYPHHKVCGEYISNEVRPFLLSLGLSINDLGISEISHFQFTSPSGRILESPLDMGGFGISRYTLDNHLYQLALSVGVKFILEKSVEQIVFEGHVFHIKLSDNQELEAQFVIGSFGKRSRIDAVLERDFFKKRSPYIGVKYHIETDFRKDAIALHNFKDGYCGISAIENNRYCLCYLTTRENLRQHTNIETMEEVVLSKNPHLKRIFKESVFLYDRPEVINEISFEPKKAVENHILMVGDAAGLITPLCGNGMAMAIHGAKILTDLMLRDLPRNILEKHYQEAWNVAFRRRLWIGRTVQQLFGDETMSEIALTVMDNVRPLLRGVIRSTHGKEI
jgi:menaquinone-9 beta-reductase